MYVMALASAGLVINVHNVSVIMFPDAAGYPGEGRGEGGAYGGMGCMEIASLSER